MAFGFKNAEGKKPIYFEGHEEPYTELVKDLTPPANAICASTDFIRSVPNRGILGHTG